MALTAGGTCWISPVRPATAFARVSAETSTAEAVPVISPSASSVLVDWPSLIVAAYSFSVRVRYPRSLVAFSTPTTRTPVANGSRVPACPTLLVPASRRIRATTSCDVMPPGLSTMTRPLGTLMPCRRSLVVAELVGFFCGLAVGVGIAGVNRAVAAAGELLVGGPGLGHQVLDSLSRVRDHFGDELQGRGMAQADLASHLGPDDASRTVQRQRRVRPFGVGPVHRVEHLGLAEVVGQPGLGDVDKTEPRVLDPPLQHYRDDLADPVGKLARPRGVHAVTPPR